MKLGLLQLGDPILRTPPKPLSAEEIRSAPVRELIEARERLSAGGVGLAAPQLGVSIQLAVIEDRCLNPFNLPPERLREQGRVPIPFHVIINPVIPSVPTLLRQLPWP